MNLLKKITPAETCLILKNQESSYIDLMKLTFLDLILKDVLEVVPDSQKEDNGKSILFEAGNNFHNYEYLSHEFVFLKLFVHAPKTQCSLVNLLSVAIEESGGLKKYRQQIRVTPCLGQFFPSYFFYLKIQNLILQETL